MKKKNVSDGSTAEYYELPPKATEIQHLISFKNMNAQIGEIFRTCYRYGTASHSDDLRDAKKIQFYANAEVERLERLINKEKSNSSHIDLDDDRVFFSWICQHCKKIHSWNWPKYNFDSINSVLMQCEQCGKETHCYFTEDGKGVSIKNPIYSQLEDIVTGKKNPNKVRVSGVPYEVDIDDITCKNIHAQPVIQNE